MRYRNLHTVLLLLAIKLAPFIALLQSRHSAPGKVNVRLIVDNKEGLPLLMETRNFIDAMTMRYSEQEKRSEANDGEADKIYEL